MANNKAILIITEPEDCPSRTFLKYSSYFLKSSSLVIKFRPTVWKLVRSLKHSTVNVIKLDRPSSTVFHLGAKTSLEV